MFGFGKKKESINPTLSAAIDSIVVPMEAIANIENKASDPVHPGKLFELVETKKKYALRTATMLIQTKKLGKRYAYFKESVETYRNEANLTLGLYVNHFEGRFDYSPFRSEEANREREQKRLFRAKDTVESYSGTYIVGENLESQVNQKILSLTANQVHLFYDAEDKLFALHSDEIAEAKLWKITKAKKKVTLVSHEIKPLEK